MAKRIFTDKDGVDRVPINANVNLAIQREFKSAMVERNIDKIQDALDQAMRQWATRQSPGDGDRIDEKPTNVIKSPDIDIRESEIKWVRLLIAILRCKYHQIVTAIQHNLNGFSLILDVSGERGSGSAPKPGGSGPKTPGPLEKARNALDATDRAFGRPPRSGRSKKAGGA